MRRILGIKMWMMFVLSFLFAHTVLAEEAASGKVNDSINAKILLLGDVSGQQAFLRYIGTGNWNGEWLRLTYNLRAAIEDEVMRVARTKFASVENMKEGSSEVDGFVIEIRVTDSSWKSYYEDIDISYSVSFNMHSSTGEQFAKNETKKTKGKFNHSVFGSSPENFKEGYAKGFKISLIEAFSNFLNAPDAVAFVQNEALQSVADGSLLENLKPYYATYRVTDSNGVIRKKPNAKSAAFKKLGTGSVVTVIGQLPEGWLQVAKEGEAIGWIHTDSVTLVSEQANEKTKVAAATPQAAPVATPAPANAAGAQNIASTYPTKPVVVNFKPAKPNPDDIAVIIGNANYKATAKDIPDVVPAYADAEGMKRYATQALGIKEENVIFIKDAKLADLIATFGNDNNPKGKLYNWVKPQASNVFIFYSGHGAPNGDGTSSYLVPVDATASLIDLSGYSLKTLYGNLGKLPAKSVTVVLEACFSGAAQAGMLIKSASPIYQKAMQEIVPTNLTVISAGTGNQIASWEQDQSHGLFTKHYLLGMSGAADKKPYGNGDGKVSSEELTAYLKATMSYMAQRYYGREQTAQIVASGKQ